MSMKEDRQCKEFFSVSKLREDFKAEVYDEEQRFSEFSSAYAKLNKDEKINPTEKYFSNVIHDSALDLWALVLDSLNDFTMLQINNSQFRKFISTLEMAKGTLPLELFDWVTPARRVDLAKSLLASASEKKSHLLVAAKILDNVIKNPMESYFYPVAQYYRAFILIKEMQGSLLNMSDSEKNNLIKTLRKAETNVCRHIEMQMGFCYTISQTLKSSRYKSLCTIDAYRQQKENDIKLLEYYIGSIRSLLGSQSCSESEFQDEIEIDEEKAAKYFEKLVDSKCIVMCQVNDAVPDRDAAVEQIADDYGVQRSALDTFLNDIILEIRRQNGLISEEDMEKKLEAANLIKWTRKSFWQTLVKAEALQEAEDCFVMLETDLCGPLTKLDPSETINFSNHGYVLYNAINKNDKKFLFSKDYVERNVPPAVYRRLESNKVAKLNLDKLRGVDKFGVLEKNHLGKVEIHREEWEAIWVELKKQNIIDAEGHLSPEYNDQDLRLPGGYSAYNDSVTSLIKRTFIADLVMRKWLQSKEDPNHLKAITALPLKPYQDLLGDLHAAHIISGAYRVTDNTDINLEDEVAKITKDEKEQQCILNFLRRRQPVYAAAFPIQNFSLEPIAETIGNDTYNIVPSLYAFGLVGFDHVINVKDRKIPIKLIANATGVITLGVFQSLIGISVGPTINYFVGSPWSSLFSSFLSSAVTSFGITDIHYAISALKSRSNFTWRDYGSQKLKSLEKSYSVFSIYKLIKSQRIIFSREFKAIDTQQRQYDSTRQNSLLEHQSTDTFDINSTVHLQVIAGHVESIVSIRLGTQCRSFRDNIKRVVSGVIDKNLALNKEKLNRFYKLQREESLQTFIAEKLNKLTADWSIETREWTLKVADVVADVLKKKSSTQQIDADQISKRIMETIQQVLDFYSLMIPVVNLTAKSTEIFLSELGNKFPANSDHTMAENIDEEQQKRFRQEVETAMKTAFNAQVGQVMEWWTERMKESVSNHIANRTAVRQ